MKLKMNYSKHYIKKGVIFFALIAALLLSGGFASKNNFEISKNLDIFATLFRELHVNYIEEVNTSKLIQAGIEEMLKTLDPYTNFIPESDIEEHRFMTTGQYGGIGAIIRTHELKIVVAEPYEGFPAHKAGLQAGDIILEVDNQSLENRSSEEVAELLKGQPGTSVDVLISRDNEPEPFEVTLKREVIKVDNIPFYGMIDDNTGYIRLNSFTQDAGREVREAFNELQDENDLEGIVLDLRDNGGGLLKEAVNVTNLFIDRNKKVASIEGRIEERNSTHKTLNNPVDLDIPLVVLVNNNSASASEIVAGAIQDYDRGVIMGERTFGKGLVQNVIPLSYNTQLKVTVAEYLIPSGRTIQAIDYAHRDEDGSVLRIPDSLKTEHETKNGRIVYDGGGIEPDISISPSSLSDISKSLLGNHLVFDFATKYHRENPEITSPQGFKITEEIYDEFLGFISDKDYDYKTSSEQKLEELKEALKEDEYYEYMDEHFYEFEDFIMEKKSKDIELFQDEIKKLLLLDIVSRYYYQSGRIEASLSEDEFVAKSIKVLHDDVEYFEILSPGRD